MTTAEAAQLQTLRINRVYSVPRQKVYDAWTQTQALEQWFSPSINSKVEVHELQVKVGGRYRITMHEPDGNHTVVGEYLTVIPGEKLVFSWRWEHAESDDAMLVTVDFTDIGESTEMTLTHEKLPSIGSRDLHNEGWTGCLNRLESLMDR